MSVPYCHNIPKYFQIALNTVRSELLLFNESHIDFVSNVFIAQKSSDHVFVGAIMLLLYHITFTGISLLWTFNFI